MTLTLEWMEWTVPTAIFCSTIILTVIAMTIWQTVSPSLERRGFLPIPTTPGDRLFIGIISSAYIFFAWIGLTHFALWILLIIVVCWIIVVMVWGWYWLKIFDWMRINYDRSYVVRCRRPSRRRCWPGKQKANHWRLIAKGGGKQRKMKETRSILPGVNGLHVSDVDREMRNQPLKAYRRWPYA